MDVVPSLTRQVLSILLVFALLSIALWKARRGSFSLALKSGNASGRAPARAMKRVERLALTQHHTVHLIRVQGREMLVATHPQGCTVLSELEQKGAA